MAWGNWATEHWGPCELPGCKESGVVGSVRFVQVAVERWAHWPCEIVEESMIWRLAHFHFIPFCGTTWFCLGFFSTTWIICSFIMGHSQAFYWALIWALSTNHYYIWSRCNNTNKARGGVELKVSWSGLDAILPWLRRMDAITFPDFL